MLAHLRPAFVLVTAFTVLTGLIYPLAVTAVVQVALPFQANGSRIDKGKTVVGSALIGQSFAADRYFHGRPSATSAPDPKDDSKTVDAPYNAANSSGSNLGPLSKKLLERVGNDVAALSSSGASTIPADAPTTSASGLDPHISPDFAMLQVARIAKARGLTAQRVQKIVQQRIELPFLGLIGEPRVNVLLLNIALDAELQALAG